MKKYFQKFEGKTKKNGGAAMLIVMIFFLFISLATIAGLVGPSVREFRNASVNLSSKQSYFLAESGSEDAYFRLKTAKPIGSSELITLNGNTATTIITDSGYNEKTISALGDVSFRQRKTVLKLNTGAGVSFNYGMQVGNGGLVMENTSRVIGSVYSNGNITGNNSPEITGDALLAGASTISGVTVGGTIQTGQPVLAMPISDATLDQWEADAIAGDTISSPCPYKPADGSSLGPVKITCDLEIDGTKIVTMTGTIWVSGNFDMKNSAQLKLAPSFGSGSGIIIVDNPSNRLTLSKIDVQNSAQILGSGTAGSYVIVVSRNNSAEGGGSETAINIRNSSNAPIYYAPYGKVTIQNSANLKEVIGYKLEIKNSATVTYESGLANTNFISGPSGGWVVGGWKEAP